MGIIWDKTPLVLINYLVVIFSDLKATGCFIHNAGLDLNCVKSTCGTKNNLWVSFGKNTIAFDELPGGYASRPKITSFFFLTQDRILIV